MGSLKNLIFRVRGRKKPIYRGNQLKAGGGGGGLGQFVDITGGVDQKEGIVFLREGVDNPMNTMWFFADPCDHHAVTRLQNIG